MMNPVLGIPLKCRHTVKNRHSVEKLILSNHCVLMSFFVGIGMALGPGAGSAAAAFGVGCGSAHAVRLTPCVRGRAHPQNN